MTTSQCEQLIEKAEAKRREATKAINSAMREWGVAFRAERERRSLSLRSVARYARVSAAFLSDVERGNRHPDADMRLELYQALHGASR